MLEKLTLSGVSFLFLSYSLDFDIFTKSYELGAIFSIKYNIQVLKNVFITLDTIKSL